MKKIFSIICIFALFQSQAFAVIYEYISDSGRAFYYYIEPETEDEVDLVNAQILDVRISTKDPNFSKEALTCEAKKQYKDLVYALYVKNKDYMWRKFPQYRYTFDEVYEMIYSFTYITTYYGFHGNTCEVYVKLDVPSIISRDNSLKKLSMYPYLLGYIYKDLLNN